MHSTLVLGGTRQSWTTTPSRKGLVMECSLIPNHLTSMQVQRSCPLRGTVKPATNMLLRLEVVRWKRKWLSKNGWMIKTDNACSQQGPATRPRNLKNSPFIGLGSLQECPCFETQIGGLRLASYKFGLQLESIRIGWVHISYDLVALFCCLALATYNARAQHISKGFCIKADRVGPHPKYCRFYIPLDSAICIILPCHIQNVSHGAHSLFWFSGLSGGFLLKHYIQRHIISTRMVATSWSIEHHIF